MGEQSAETIVAAKGWIGWLKTEGANDRQLRTIRRLEHHAQ
ncbi:MAG: hypothetical protein P8173_08750 [Gammaproteobacteria bacterium]